MSNSSSLEGLVCGVPEGFAKQIALRLDVDPTSSTRRTAYDAGSANPARCRARLAEMTRTKTSSVSRCAGCSAISLNAVSYVSRHGDRTKHLAFCFAFDDREGHLDV